MQRLFPRALLACIIEGRAPNSQELECVTDKILREAFAVDQSYGRLHAAAVARAALAGVDVPAAVSVARAA